MRRRRNSLFSFVGLEQKRSKRATCDAYLHKAQNPGYAFRKEMKEERDIEKIDIELMVIEMRGEGIREEESAVDKFYQKFKLMATGNFFKGTTHDQDARFANKERKMLNSMDWPE